MKIGDHAETVRHIGVGTSRFSSPTRGAERSGRAAQPPTPDWRPARTIQLVFERPASRSFLGRLLAYVYAGDSFLNAELVAAGYAEVATRIHRTLRHRRHS